MCVCGVGVPEDRFSDVRQLDLVLLGLFEAGGEHALEVLRTGRQEHLVGLDRDPLDQERDVRISHGLLHQHAKVLGEAGLADHDVAELEALAHLLEPLHPIVVGHHLQIIPDFLHMCVCVCVLHHQPNVSRHTCDEDTHLELIFFDSVTIEVADELSEHADGNVAQLSGWSQLHHPARRLRLRHGMQQHAQHR
jgi:hypothetical protein